MPRPKKAEQPRPNSVVASAARVMAGRRQGRPVQGGSGSAWQDQAWDMLDQVGELEFYREWISNALSRCTLDVVEELPDGTEVPATDPTVLAAHHALFGGEAGQGNMLASMGGHLAIPGESWLCGLVEPPTTADAPDMWRVLSHSEVREQGTKWMVDRGDGVQELYDPEQVIMIRVWRPHPRKGVEAHSSVRSALPILRELVGLSKHVGATIDSRLAGAGILLLPSEMTFTAPPTPDGDGEADPEEDPFLATLTEAMMNAIENRGSPDALTPIVVRVPGQWVDKIQHLTFATPFDAKSIELRQEAIRRLANSLDVPAEVLTGMANVNHWTGWLLDENAIKMHVEPLLNLITHGITTRYLWPCLQTGDYLDPAMRRFKIKGDTSQLRQRPNRSAEAIQLHGANAITDKALGRESGFEPEDLLAPESPEFKRRVLMRLATTGTPEVVMAAMDALGIPIGLPEPEPDAPAAPAAPAELEAPPETSRDLPQQEQAAAVLAAAEVLTLRAVERGWNRAGRRGRVRKPVPAPELDAALSDAWDHVPRAAALLGVDPVRLEDTLNTYARTLLTTGADHDPRTLANSLMAQVLSPAVLAS